MELILKRENLKELMDGRMCTPNTEKGLKQWKSTDLDVKMEIIEVDHVHDSELAEEMLEYLR